MWPQRQSETDRDGERGNVCVYLGLGVYIGANTEEGEHEIGQHCWWPGASHG